MKLQILLALYKERKMMNEKSHSLFFYCEHFNFKKNA